MALAYTQAVQMQEARVSPLGETLQRARQARGITVEDAERATRIPRRYLEALEQENFAVLPAPVYARGFLRSYSGYLGLDPAELLPFFPVGHVDEPSLQPLPDLAGLSLDDAVAVVEEAGAGYIVVGVSEGEVPDGQVVDQEPAPGTEIGSGDLVTLIVSR